MKNKIRIFLIGSVFILSIININSCRKNFTIDEFDKLSDSIHLEGSIAIPLVNTELKLANFIPANDSSLWAEIDDEGLIHLRMYYVDLVTIPMKDIYPESAVTYPIPSGSSVPPYIQNITTDTTKMKVYDKLLSGKLFFNDPSIKFHIRNEIPVVTYFKLDTLTFHDFNENALSHKPHTEYTIPASTSPGITADTIIVIDKQEVPGLDTVFAPVPKFISFNITTGSTTSQTVPFEATGDEEIKIDVDIDLPLHARLDTIVMSDTVSFPVEDILPPEVSSATLKIIFNNEFPIDGFSQIYFADTTATGEIGFLIDSVFTDTNVGWHLLAADTDSQGISTVSHESSIEVTVDKERIDRLTQHHATKIIIIGKLNTKNTNTNRFVKIMEHYIMGVKIGIKVDYEAGL